MPIIVFNCKATSVYDLIDPQSLRALSGMSIYEGDTNAVPEAVRRCRCRSRAAEPARRGHGRHLHRGYRQERLRRPLSPTDTKRIHLKMIMAAGPAANRLLLLNSTLPDEVIPEPVAGTFARALPLTSDWQPTIEGVYPSRGMSKIKSKSFYLKDLTGADKRCRTIGVVSLDRHVFDPAPPRPDEAIAPSARSTNRGCRHGLRAHQPGTDGAAKPFKIVTLDKPWYVTCQGVYLDKDAGARTIIWPRSTRSWPTASDPAMSACRRTSPTPSTS